jgi:hypothetical protein
MSTRENCLFLIVVASILISLVLLAFFNKANAHIERLQTDIYVLTAYKQASGE